LHLSYQGIQDESRSSLPLGRLISAALFCNAVSKASLVGFQSDTNARTRQTDTWDMWQSNWSVLQRGTMVPCTIASFIIG